MNDFKGIIEDVEKSSLVSDKVIKKVIEIIGQKKWQDINDKGSDICTTTGELIITLKRIPDLEEELKNWKDEWHWTKKEGYPKDNKAYLALIDYGILGTEYEVRENLKDEQPYNLVKWKEIK